MEDDITVFSDKDPVEKVRLGFEFVNELGDATINSIVWTVTRLSGPADADPNVTMKDGAAQVQGTKAVQMIQAGVEGTDYQHHCKITASDGQILIAVGRMAVRSKRAK